MDPSSKASPGLFVDAFVRALDSSRRIVLPAVWREMVGEPRRLLLLMAPDGPYLLAYPAGAMMERLRGVARNSLADSGRTARAIASRSRLLDWDAQGRIRIPDELLAHAGIRCDVRLLGAIDHFEIRSTDAPWPDPEPPEVLREAMRAVGL